MSKFGFGFGAPVMGPLAGFGANNGRVPKYTPGAVQSQPMMMPGQGEDVDELLAMLDSQSRGQNRPPAAMHAQPGPTPPQAPAPAQEFPASPIQAPKDRGMFGRFLGGLGKVAGKAGEFAMFGPVGMQIRADHRRGEEKAERKTAEEEARRRAMAQQLGVNPELFAMDPAMGLQFMQQQQAAAERADDRTYNRGRDQVGDERFERQWLTEQQRFESEQERADRLEARGIMESDRSFGLQEREFGLRQTEAQANDGMGSFGLTPVYGRDKDGNRVILQTNKAGGVIQSAIPEGVTLEDEFSKSYDRTAGKGAAEKEMYQTTAGMGVLAAEEGFNRVSKQIDDAIAMSDSANTGLIMGNAPAPNLQGLLDTIGANTAFESLVALKAQGGTLGALSDAELGLLMSKVANLKRSQSQEQLDANLEILKIAMQNSMMRIKKAYETGYQSGEFGRASAAPSAASSGARAGPSGQTPPPAGFTIID